MTALAAILILGQLVYHLLLKPRTARLADATFEACVRPGAPGGQQ